MKIKPESEISCHITLTVISGLYSVLNIFHCSSLHYRVGNSGVKLAVKLSRGSPHP